MQKKNIKSGKYPVGKDDGKKVYAIMHSQHPESGTRVRETGSRLQEAVSSTGSGAAPALETGGGSSFAARLPSCQYPARAGSSEAAAVFRGGAHLLF